MAEEDRPATDDAFLDALRAEWIGGFHDGRYQEAFSALQSAVVETALHWFADEGIVFARPDPAVSAAQPIKDILQAAFREMEEREGTLPLKLYFATEGLAAVAELKRALNGPIGDTPDEVALKVAEIASIAANVGRIDGAMIQFRRGAVDRIGELIADRSRRRFGAAKLNAAKAAVKERALGEARRILRTNPTLSHEDLALKIRDALHLSQAVKTITDWVRAWRKSGELAAAKSGR